MMQKFDFQENVYLPFPATNNINQWLLAHFRTHRTVSTVYFRLWKQGFSPGWITSSFPLGNTRN